MTYVYMGTCVSAEVRGFIRMVYRLWSNKSRNGCLSTSGRSKNPQLFSLQGWIFQLSSVYVGIQRKQANASERMGLAGRQRESFLLSILYIGCQLKVWPRLKVNLLTSKIWNRSGFSHFKQFKFKRKNSHKHTKPFS